jgi:hypothetical protein
MCGAADAVELTRAAGVTCVAEPEDGPVPVVRQDLVVSGKYNQSYLRGAGGSSRSWTAMSVPVAVTMTFP